MANSAACSSSTDSTINIRGKEGQDDQQQNNSEIRTLMSDIEKEVEMVSSLRSDYDIYRVPMQLHKLKPEAYTPQSVSIGPLHYKDEHLQTMHTHKLRYLNRLLNRPSGKTLDVYVKGVSNLEEKARKCYSETIMDFGRDEFVKMMVIDGCFILEFLLIKTLTEKDHFRSKLSWNWEINTDFIKLENQLPFFVLDFLYGLIIFDGYNLTPPYNTLTSSHHIYASLLHRYAEGLHGLTLHGDEDIKSLPIPDGGAKHFVDLLRYALIPSFPTTRRRHGEKYLPLKYCASQLRSAGVKLQKKDPSDSPKTYLFDIEFDVNKGVLTIPTILIWDETELVLRNLIAFEQGETYIEYFTMYTAFMDGLIDTAKDVELLEQKGIITNNLGSREDVVTLFNNINKQVVLGDPYFSGVVKDLEEYHNKAWNKRKAGLMQNYFNSPWSSISVGAAALLLLLTIIQTIFSILLFFYST
ncbi:UPF0481 protein At3g47200-like [Macadamia integrifolia]|uniref:UPF0481 protein At3g47200-like n=1 Tax=Macadamia integrifolia TaxID=60698 RepID=UPI001C4E4EF3|nr:UPF0481 protein At3g47200-like [Macadamia integrifolia]